MTAFRRSRSIVLVASAALFGFTATAQARQGQGQEPQPAYAVVNEAGTQVRSGPYQSYYPFGELKQGDVIEVVGELRGWARVRTVGPAFKDFFGYIRHAKSLTDKVRLSADGKTGTAMGRLDILAPNIATQSPDESWRTIARVEADTKLRILNTIETDRDVVHRVVLPADAEGWISIAQLRAASVAEIQNWRDAVAGRAASPAPSSQTGPATPPAQNTADHQADPPVLPKPEERITPANRDAGQSKPAQATTTPPTVASGDAASTSTAATRDRGKVPTDVDPDVERFESLEAAFKKLEREPIETAEVTPLHDLYLELAERTENPQVGAYASTRAEQLQIWSELQIKRADLLAARARTRMSAEEAETTRLLLEAAGNYRAVGRLAASTIYDGKRLPRLLRLQDPSNKRTVAYVLPSNAFDLTSMIGQLIGVHGDVEYDGSLRLNIITPARIDILTPSGDVEDTVADG